MPISAFFRTVIKHVRSDAPLILILASIVVLQGFCALFFLGDAFVDIAEDGLTLHMQVEMLAVVSLLLGVVVGALVIRHLFLRTTGAETELTRLRGTFTGMVSNRFREWGLTGSETEVAWLLLKGFEIAEIAQYRNTAPSTVRVQLSRIYEKAGTQSRGPFVSQFIDPMLDTGSMRDTAR